MCVSKHYSFMLVPILEFLKNSRPKKKKNFLKTIYLILWPY